MNSPNTLEGNYADKLDTASAKFQKTASTVDFVIEGEEEVLNSVRELITILPQNNNETGISDECMDDLNRVVDAFAAEAADPAVHLQTSETTISSLRKKQVMQRRWLQASFVLTV